MPLSHNFRNLTLGKPSSGFHLVTWERVTWAHFFLINIFSLTSSLWGHIFSSKNVFSPTHILSLTPSSLHAHLFPQKHIFPNPISLRTHFFPWGTSFPWPTSSPQPHLLPRPTLSPWNIFSPTPSLHEHIFFPGNVFFLAPSPPPSLRTHLLPNPNHIPNPTPSQGPPSPQGMFLP